MRFPASPATPAASEPANDETTAVKRSEPFTEQQLLAAWKHYIDTHPQEKLVTGTMVMAKPKKVSDTLYEIEVASPGQKEFFENSKQDILESLRTAVQNDALTIEVSVSENLTTHRIMTPREVVEEIKQHNARFTEFLKTFQLGLA